MQVAVIGPSQPTEQEAALAERVGQLLAERGAVLLSGGEEGVMEAACKGAKETGGAVVGILGGSNTAEANAFLAVSVVTGIGMARNTILIRSAEAVIAVGCSWGTLVEMGLAVKLGRPLIALHGWRVTDERGVHVDGEVRRAVTAEEAVASRSSLTGPQRRGSLQLPPAVHLRCRDEVAHTLQGQVLVRQLEPAATTVRSALSGFHHPGAGVFVYEDVHAGQATPAVVPVVLAPFHQLDGSRTGVRGTSSPSPEGLLGPNLPVAPYLPASAS